MGSNAIFWLPQALHACASKTLVNIKIKLNECFKLEKEIQLDPTSALLEFSRTVIWLGWRAEVLYELPRYLPPHLLTPDYVFDYILLLFVWSLSKIRLEGGNINSLVMTFKGSRLTSCSSSPEMELATFPLCMRDTYWLTASKLCQKREPGTSGTGFSEPLQLLP